MPCKNELTFCSSADQGDDTTDDEGGDVVSAATLLSLAIVEQPSSVINLSTNSLAGSGPASHCERVASHGVHEYSPNFCSFFTMATTIVPVF